MRAIEQTARFWSEKENWPCGYGLYWTEIPAVQRRLNVKVSGDPEVHWVSYTLNRYLRHRMPFQHCLSLGCGNGHLERQLARLGVFSACDAYDVAPGMIEDARQAALVEGYNHICYEITDVNRIQLPAQFYDVVWINSAMHHFQALEHICDQISQGLRPDGLLVLNEYVGPSRYQFIRRQQEVMQAALMLIPPHYRALAAKRVEQTLSRTPWKKGWIWAARRAMDKVKEGEIWPTLRRRWYALRAKHLSSELQKNALDLPSVGDVIAADPSEAVRSGDILELVEHYFEIVDCKELGGTVLQFVLDGIAHNFLSNDAVAGEILELLFQIEDTMMACGELQSDFVYLVAAPKT